MPGSSCRLCFEAACSCPGAAGCRSGLAGAKRAAQDRGEEACLHVGAELEALEPRDCRANCCHSPPQTMKSLENFW